jgi:hypothetical protein
MLQIGNDSLPYFRSRNYKHILLATLDMAVPAAYLWLANFYLLFHCYMNLLAEFTGFADRRFYADWWNSGDLNEFWRKWNIPTHNFLLRHVYLPMRRRGVTSFNCMMSTFFVSACFHEYVVAGVFNVFNLLSFALMMINVPLIQL